MENENAFVIQPVFLQLRHTPSLVHSLLLWPGWLQLEQTMGAVHSAARCPNL